MSCFLEWQKIVEVAQRASDESIGANWKVNSRNLDLIYELTRDIEKRIGVDGGSDD
jgi:hypothetical protein